MEPCHGTDMPCTHMGPYMVTYGSIGGHLWAHRWPRMGHYMVTSDYRWWVGGSYKWSQQYAPHMLACTKYWTVILLASTALGYYTSKTWDKTLLSLGNSHLNHITVIHRFSQFFNFVLDFLGFFVWIFWVFPDFFWIFLFFKFFVGFLLDFLYSF